MVRNKLITVNLLDCRSRGTQADAASAVFFLERPVGTSLVEERF
jgi:hypothetical protein